MSSFVERRRAAADAVMHDIACEATLAVLSERGLGGLTMERVAEAAGMAKGTLYNYFDNKDHLVFDVIDQVIDPISEAGRRIVDDEGYTPEEKLGCLALGLLRPIEEQRGVLTILAEAKHTSPAIHRHVREKGRVFIDLIERVVRSGIDLGRFRPVNARQCARFIQGAIVLVCEDIFEPVGDSLPIEQEVADLIDVFVSGLSLRNASEGAE